MKEKLNPQTGTSIGADFEDNTWTFEMEQPFIMRAGKFVIIPFEDYKPDLINAEIKKLKRKLNLIASGIYGSLDGLELDNSCDVVEKRIYINDLKEILEIINKD